MLTASQKDTFDRDGYLVVRGMFDGAAMRDIAAWTEELETAPEVSGRHWVYREKSLLDGDRRVLQRIENFYPFHEGFRRLMSAGPLCDAVDALFDERSVLFKVKINFKMPGGDGFKLHQDQQAGWSRYASLFITALVSIDEATVENGCLEVAAGLHRKDLLGEEWKPLPDDLPGLELVAVPTKPGDVVFFDSYTPHASKPNFTDRWRRVLYVTWNRAAEGDHRERYYADKHRNFPPDVDREAGKNYVFRV
jgi:ectoine hydroxylase-related dioxygenase (phytanoyl-CoA dioxygenase family)